MHKPTNSWRNTNKIKINEQRKKYRNREDIKEHIKEKNKEYLPIRKEKIKQRRLIDNNFRISEALRSKFHKFIKGRKTSISNYLGCDLNFYIKWIESNFIDTMSWDNYGKEWDMDHVIPTSILNFSIEKNIKFCYNWTNFRPSKKSDNMSKSNKLYINYILNQINDVKKYIRYIADRRLISLGLKGIFKVKKNPLPWVEEMINAPIHGNFFENRVTDYAKGALTGSWGDVWAQ